jgi:hypothetical protein
MRKIKGGVIFLLAFAVAMLALPGVVAYAQQEPDHHKCYNVEPLGVHPPPYPSCSRISSVRWRDWWSP